MAPPGGHLLFLSLIPIILIPPEGGPPSLHEGPLGAKKTNPPDSPHFVGVAHGDPQEGGWPM